MGDKLLGSIGEMFSAYAHVAVHSKIAPLLGGTWSSRGYVAIISDTKYSRYEISPNMPNRTANRQGSPIPGDLAQFLEDTAKDRDCFGIVPLTVGVESSLEELGAVKDFSGMGMADLWYLPFLYRLE